MTKQPPPPELSVEQQLYLRAAFAAYPSDWFRPRSVGTREFSDREIDRITESLDQRGLMQAQPDLHARLTPRGRKEAAHLCAMDKRDWRQFYHRRKVRIALAAGAVAITVSLVALKLTGVV